MTEGQPLASKFHVLLATPGLVRLLVDGVTVDMIEAPVDEGWSAKHVLAHLFDIDDVFTGQDGRIRRIVREERPFIRSIDPTDRMLRRNLLDRSPEDLLIGFEARRTASVQYLKSLTAADLARVGTHDEAGEISGENLAWQWAYHDLMHIEQLCAILKAPLLGAMGNTRLFYFDV